MTMQAPGIADLDFQVGDHVCAFYSEGANGGSSLEDLMVIYVSRGLRARNKCICFGDAGTATSVKSRIPNELESQGESLQFITQDDAFYPKGGFAKESLIRKLEVMVEEALAGGYARFWVLCDVAFAVRPALDMIEWFAFESQVNEFAPKYPQFLMCLYNLDRFDGELVMSVLQTHPRIFVNGLILKNPYYVRPPELLGNPQRRSRASHGALPSIPPALATCPRGMNMPGPGWSTSRLEDAKRPWLAESLYGAERGREKATYDTSHTQRTEH